MKALRLVLAAPGLWLGLAALHLVLAAGVAAPVRGVLRAAMSPFTIGDERQLLGPLFAPLARIPRSVMLWGGWFQTRIRPNDPRISPVFGDLAQLPPLLIHASESEMLRDDSIRYFNKARAAGSPVKLQTWNHVVHVWHIFNPELTEARDAFEEIRKFLARLWQALELQKGDPPGS